MLCYFAFLFFHLELKTIEQRLEQGVYTKLADFVSDACRMFDNCKHYNPGNSKISKKAGLLEGFLVQKLRLLRQKIVSWAMLGDLIL